MLHYALVFFVVALIAAVFGFGGIAAGAAEIAKILFFIFLILFVVSLVAGCSDEGSSAIGIAEDERMHLQKEPVCFDRALGGTLLNGPPSRSQSRAGLPPTSPFASLAFLLSTNH